MWTDRVGGISLKQPTETLQPRLATLGTRKAAAVLFDTSFLKGTLAAASFVDDQQGTLVTVFSATHQGEGYGLEVGGSGEFITTAVYPSARKKQSLASLISDPNATQITDEERHRYRMLSIRQRAIPGDIKRLQPVAMSLRHAFGPPYEPGVPTSRIMIRGEYNEEEDGMQGSLVMYDDNKDRFWAVGVDAKRADRCDDSI